MIASDSFSALGTTASLFVTERVALDRARAILDEELAAIDRACSRFRPDSDLSRVNSAPGETIACSELLIEAVEVAIDAAERTAGAVDPTLGHSLSAIGYDRDFRAIAAPDRTVTVVEPQPERWREVQVDRLARTVAVPADVELDLGATAKALAADRAARRIVAEIGVGALVNLGGDLSIAGEAPAGGWLVRVTDDHAAGPTAPGQTVSLSSGGLATSSITVRRWATGDGERHHIVDPSSGDSADEVWRTVSVAARLCVDANMASTAAIVGGEDAPGWLAGLGLPSRLVRPGGEVVHVAGWPEESLG